MELASNHQESKFKKPDLKPLLKASEMLGKVLKKGDIVIYESTVYPGVTEDECVPVLEKHSGLKFNKDFYCGYSPERINPGDKNHRIQDIKKVTFKIRKPRLSSRFPSLIKQIF